MKYFVTSRLSENIHETPEGYLLCLGVPIARTGEMLYGEGETPLETDDSGKIVIDRADGEVFRPETIASFEGKAVTITHPTEFVSPDNWSRLAKGIIQNVRRGEGEQKTDLLADLLITDSMAINLVKSGLREVSCGYEAEYTQTGDGRGMQTNIIGNHLALVDQGRAGSSYAINDHKGKGFKMKFGDKIKAIFAKAQDEAMNLAADAEKDEPKKDDDKSKDASMGAYDELVNMVKDLGEKIAAMGGKPKDASTAPTNSEPAKIDAKDEPVEVSLEDRMKALETAVAKLLEGKAAAGDADEEESEESEDEGSEEGSLVGDTASRVEILAPGMAITKDVKAKALKAAYATAEGKKVIDAVSGGKPTFDSADKVDTLFIAASELLKVSRASELSDTKKSRATDSDSSKGKGPMTAEQMNELNAKHYAKK